MRPAFLPFLGGLWLAACARESAAPALDAAFVVAAGDSTFLLDAGPRGIDVFRAPLLLARLEGRLHEVYLVDRDFSFNTALFVSQAVYRRDLVSGDSMLVWEDPRIADIARRWQRRHPDDVPLAADEEQVEDPPTQATSDTELLDVVGPFLNIEFHVDVDAEQEPHEHQARRLVVDLRTGRQAAVETLTDSATAARAVAHGERLYRSAVDSVRRTTDARAVRAREVVGAFRFDPTSFELVDIDTAALVTFYAPGHGASAAGYVLPLGDAAVTPGEWMHAFRDTRPSSFDTAQVAWRDTAWTLRATVQGDGATALLAIDHQGRRTPITEVPVPVRRLYRLSAGPGDRRERDALRRAFAEWASDAVVSPTTLTRRTRRPVTLSPT